MSSEVCFVTLDSTFLVQGQEALGETGPLSLCLWFGSCFSDSSLQADFTRLDDRREVHRYVPL